MESVSLAILSQWEEEEIAAALEWAQANASCTEKELTAYRAGLQQGWGRLRGLIHVHGGLKVKE